MNTNLTELVFVLDRSGSMEELTADTIGGYNTMINKQKKEEGEALVTTVLFDDKYKMLYNGIDLQKVEPLTEKQYYTRGMTALYDAVGRTISCIDEKHRMLPGSLIPGKILFVIMTDGMENASEKYDVTTIKSMIEQHKEKGWEFVFIGANIDAVEVGDTIGIDQDFSVSYKADRVGMKKNFDAIHCLANDIRFEKKISSAWKADIEEHNR